MKVGTLSSIRAREDIDAAASWLVYSYPGIGKTYFLGSGITNPSLAPMLWLDFDRGRASLPTSDDILIAELDESKSMEEFVSVVKRLRANQEPFADIKSVVIDSLTKLISTEMANIRESKVGQSFGKGGVRTLETNTQQDYLQLGNRIEYIMGAINSTGRHVLATAHAKELSTIEEVGGTTRVSTAEISIDAPPFVKRKLEQAFGYIWFLYRAKNGRVNLLLADRDFGPNHPASPFGGLIRAKTRNRTFVEALWDISVRDQKGNPTGIINLGQTIPGKEDDEPFYTFDDLFTIYTEAMKG